MIRALIIEDEQPAARRLEKMLLDLGRDIKVEAFLESVSAAKRWLSQNLPPDLLLLDIQLADGNSFEIFRDIELDAHVIFTTAYDQFAIKAFELNSVDYLLKPISQEKLEVAIVKLEKYRHIKKGHDIAAALEALELGQIHYKERFVINIGQTIRSIESKQIAYFYSMRKSQFLCTNEGRHYPVDHSLDNLAEMLDPKKFFRINRKFLISYNAIDRIRVLSKSRISVDLNPGTKEDLLVSSTKSHQFRLWLDR